MARGEEKYLESRKYQLRDYAALVAIAGNILLALGWVGKLYVDSYRLNQLEKSAEERALIINSLQLQFNQHLNFAEGKVKELDVMMRRVDACCPIYHGRGK